MRINCEIDDPLFQKALQLSGLKTKRAVVEAGLRMLIRVREQEEILKLAGKVRWVGGPGREPRGFRIVVVFRRCVVWIVHDDRDFEPMVRFLGLRTI